MESLRIYERSCTDWCGCALILRVLNFNLDSFLSAVCPQNFSSDSVWFPWSCCYLSFVGIYQLHVSSCPHFLPSKFSAFPLKLHVFVAFLKFAINFQCDSSEVAREFSLLPLSSIFSILLKLLEVKYLFSRPLFMFFAHLAPYTWSYAYTSTRFQDILVPPVRALEVDGRSVQLIQTSVYLHRRLAYKNGETHTIPADYF